MESHPFQLTKVQPKRVIIDTDPGFDDYWALLVFLFAQKMGWVKIEAITCTAGNADLNNTCRNTVRLLELTGTTDIPLYKGTPPPRNGSQVGYFLYDGFGDMDDIYQSTDSELSTVIREKPAEEIISEIVYGNQKEISLICIGPVTYIASILRTNPNFKNQIKDIWIMGGNDPDNEKHVLKPEFNFLSDPESVDVVLKSLDCPIYLFPFESGLDIPIPLTWRYAVLDFESPTIALTTKVEKKVNALHNETIFNVLDAYLAFLFLSPEKHITKSEKVHIEIELSDPKKRGLLTFSKNGERKVNVIKEIDVEIYKRLLVEVARYF